MRIELPRVKLLASLTLFQIDPFYRTIRGFITIIEMIWFSFGYRFTLEFNTGNLNQSPSKTPLPLFLFFMDCIFQLMHIFESSVEFNQTLLLTIIDSAY